jgi:hypothetical protein
LADVAGSVQAALEASGIPVWAGSTIAVAVGSRGIRDLVPAVAATVAWIRERGATPVIVPAMGSHGGASADGQVSVLAHLGVSRETMGCEVRATMDVVTLPVGDLPVPVVLDAAVAGTDGVILVNRVKPHTDFHGPHESGLVKMAAIGLGNHVQAEALHRRGVPGLADVMPQVGARVIASGHVLGGVALVEDPRERTIHVEAIAAGRIVDRERALLDIARSNMPSLLVTDLDVLIVDQMGKDVSGCGMDTNVIGRLSIAGQPEPVSPRVRMISCHGLTPASEGNATGVGLADVVSRALADSIDWGVTRTNIVTSGFLLRGKLPVVADTDADAWDYCIRGAGVLEVGAVRAMRIVDTLHCDEAWVSPALVDEVLAIPGVTLVNRDRPLHDAGGRLSLFA